MLEIFVRQTTLMLGRMSAGRPALAAAAAHTLKGSARGIGAWRVARAAERVEEAVAARRDRKVVTAAIAELDAASAEVRSAIRARLRDYSAIP